MQRSKVCSIFRIVAQPKPLVVCGAAAFLLVGCTLLDSGEAERQQTAAAERQRQLNALVSSCRRQQPAVTRQLQTLNTSTTALIQLNQQRYVPLPQPAAPDPTQLKRFTRDDQELELERHEQALARWRQRDGVERRRWELQQEQQRQRLTAEQLQARIALDKLGVATSPEAQTAWTRCDREQLGALTQPLEQHSRATF
jgi:hypothetical protein